MSNFDPFSTSQSSHSTQVKFGLTLELKSIFYSALVGEFLRIGRSTLRFEDFVPKAKELFDRMLTQGAKASVSRKMILKIMSKHPEDFAQFKTEHEEILKSVTNV